ncbi:MAG: hypothetical protein LBP95_04675 [Deltaproteobacteria bacterium]|jgi:KDO2-lipid IV(A) lauroyltransferase|nr:hypothetical protein [Deltaproteobacteria bacterium]
MRASKFIAGPLVRLLLAACWFVSWLPGPVLAASGDFAGRLYFRLSLRRRLVAVNNIAEAQALGHVDPALPAEKIALASFKNLGRTFLEAACLVRPSHDRFASRTTVLGVENIRDLVLRARKSGPGIIFLTGHAGNWELASLALGDKFDIKIDVVGRSQGPVFDELLKRARSSGGGRYIFKDGGARDMLGLVRGGGFLGTLFDQAAMVGPLRARLSFLGREALTGLGPFKLASMTGAHLVPILCRRERGRHVVEIYPPVSPPQDKRDKNWMMTTAQHLNDLLGGFITRYPDQWLWSHRRWKQ